MGFFRKGASPFQTPLAMIGPKPGSRIVVLGAGDGTLAAELGVAAGLNGHVVVVDRAEGAKARVAMAAVKAGALLNFEDAPITMLPIDPDDFDIVVIERRYAQLSDDDRRHVLAESIRVARPGGRLIIVESTPRQGMFGVVSPKGTVVPPDTIREDTARAGWKAARVLADVEGVCYVEAVKERLRPHAAP